MSDQLTTAHEKRNPYTWLFISLIIIISISAFLYIRNVFSPVDWVKVHLEEVPSDVATLYLVAKKDGRIFPLRWYMSMGSFLSVDPKVAGEQWYWTVKGAERIGEVQWVNASSIGILARLKSGKWILWWLKPEWISGPSSLRFISGGGETVTIQTRGIEFADNASKDLIDQVKEPMEESK
jgi:hypothetical protein